MPESIATLSDGTKRLAPRTGTSFFLKQGQILTVIDPQGLQVADLLAFNANDTRETFSNGRTFDYNKSIKLTTDHAIYSNRSNVLLRIVHDTVGVHDFLFTPCSVKTFRLLYDEGGETDDKEDDHHSRPSCFGNFAFVLEKHGIQEDQIPVPFNCFMNVRVDAETGRVDVLPPVTKAGDHVKFVAEMDLLVALTACSAPRSNAGVPKAVDYRID